MSHYTYNVEVISPMINLTIEIKSGTLQGKASVRQYWRAALEKMPEHSLLMLMDGVGLRVSEATALKIEYLSPKMVISA